MKHDFQSIVTSLDSATVSCTPVGQWNLDSQTDLKSAYQIQEQVVNQRLLRGEKIVGCKLGFTSEEKMQQMGVNEIIWGRLTDRMKITNQEILDSGRFIQPKVEPEIAFRVSKSIAGQIELSDVINYVDGVAAALEVTDSRYKNFDFSLNDIIADNCFAAGFLIGDWMPLTSSFRGLDISLKINGEVVKSGNSDAILGDPLKSIVALSQLMEKYDHQIGEGSVIMAGATTTAAPLRVGQKVQGDYGSLGILNFEVR